MEMFHPITLQFAESWYNQKVDPNSTNRDPKHAKINRNVKPTITAGKNKKGQLVFCVRFKHFIDGYFKSAKKKRTIYQKKFKWRHLKPHETYHDAKRHMYHDIYMYLHRCPSPPLAKQKRKRQVQERVQRHEKREEMKDPKVREKRRSTNFQLLMQDVREFNKKCLNQREKLRLRKRKPSTNIKPSSDHSGAPSKRLKKKTKNELKVEEKKAQIENLLVKFSELKATMKINYEWLRKVGFADHWQKKKKKAGVADDESSQNDESSKAGVAHIDESSQHDELIDSFQDDDVPTMMALANLSDKQVKQMYHQLVSLWIFCSIHIDDLKECLAEVEVIIEAIKNGDECNSIGPGIPGISTSIKQLEHSWQKYGLFMYADKQAPKATKMRELVKHWLKEGTFKIPNWNKGGHQSWFLRNEDFMFVFKKKMKELMNQRKLSVLKMHRFVHSMGEFSRNGGFKALVQKGSRAADISKIFPKTLTASPSTVLRWMHVCNAKYVRYEMGFVDRRNDGDVIHERDEYSKKSKELQRRQKLWIINENGEPMLVDMARNTNPDIENCKDKIYTDLQTWYKIKGIPPPKCKHGHDVNTCKCQRAIIHCGHDEAIFWCNLLNPTWALCPAARRCTITETLS